MKLVCLFSGSVRLCGSLRPIMRLLFVVEGVAAEEQQHIKFLEQQLPLETLREGGEIGSSHVPVYSTHGTETGSIGEDTPSERRERKKWTLTEDVVLISAWLNTSKDPVVGNEQRAGAFWKRIAAYFAASPKVQGGEKRESIQCKQRWQKINDLVSKFSGSYEAATRQKTSGMNENDVLRFDQKWCEVATSKIDGSCKKRKGDDGAQSSSSYATTTDGEHCPPDVKASKRASAKKTNEDISELQSLCAIKEKDLEVKEKLSKMGLLQTLIAKTEPLSEFEEALKKNLITEMLGSVLGGSV
ncbi:PREDICTED: glutathione S-transferase T3-like [Brassica oleracea var. oleracea]|uniref:glutathione S-transferase T3-like n=1 Tax=Brassica oleracea var. oleracea TaxID=109376 RepID=UPI0006A74D86|nr:PREDICTED: glutathione S-transferase T3-like [Brassica oleracea var. oleracea]